MKEGNRNPPPYIKWTEATRTLLYETHRRLKPDIEHISINTDFGSLRVYGMPSGQRAELIDRLTIAQASFSAARSDAVRRAKELNLTQDDGNISINGYGAVLPQKSAILVNEKVVDQAFARVSLEEFDYTEETHNSPHSDAFVAPETRSSHELITVVETAEEFTPISYDDAAVQVRRDIELYLPRKDMQPVYDITHCNGSILLQNLYASGTVTLNQGDFLARNVTGAMYAQVPEGNTELDGFKGKARVTSEFGDIFAKDITLTGRDNAFHSSMGAVDVTVVNDVAFNAASRKEPELPSKEVFSINSEYLPSLENGLTYEITGHIGPRQFQDSMYLRSNQGKVTIRRAALPTAD